MPGVFISYRRGGGKDFSRFIETFLGAAGLDVFLDVDSLRGGHFDEQLLRHIEVRDVVILICSPGCFDRCVDPADWVRRELEHAITLEKRIVPVSIEGFTWPRPEELPESIRSVTRHNAFEYSASFRVSRLRARRPSRASLKRRRRWNDATRRASHPRSRCLAGIQTTRAGLAAQRSPPRRGYKHHMDGTPSGFQEQVLL